MIRVSAKALSVLFMVVMVVLMVSPFFGEVVVPCLGSYLSFLDLTVDDGEDDVVACTAKMATDVDLVVGYNSDSHSR